MLKVLCKRWALISVCMVFGNLSGYGLTGWVHFGSYPDVYSAKEKTWFRVQGGDSLLLQGPGGLQVDNPAGKGWIWMDPYPFVFSVDDLKWSYAQTPGGRLGIVDLATGEFRVLGWQGTTGVRFESYSNFAYEAPGWQIDRDFGGRRYSTDCEPLFVGAEVEVISAPGTPYSKQWVGTVLETGGRLHSFVTNQPFAWVKTNWGADVQFKPYYGEHAVLFVHAEGDACGTALRMDVADSADLPPRGQLFSRIAGLDPFGRVTVDSMQLLPPPEINAVVESTEFEFPVRWSMRDLDSDILTATLKANVEGETLTRIVDLSIEIQVDPGFRVENFRHTLGNIQSGGFTMLGPYLHQYRWFNNTNRPFWAGEDLDCEVTGVAVLPGIKFINLPNPSGGPLSVDRRRPEVQLELTVTDTQGNTHVTRKTVWPKPPPLEVSLTPADDGSGPDGTFTYYVDANGPWSVFEEVDWLTIEPLNGLAGRTTLTVTLEPNTGTTQRDGDVFIGNESFTFSQPASQNTETIDLRGQWRVTATHETCPDLGEILISDVSAAFASGQGMVYDILLYNFVDVDCSVQNFPSGFPIETTEPFSSPIVTVADMVETYLAIPYDGFDPDRPPVIVDADTFIQYWIFDYVGPDFDEVKYEIQTWRRTSN